MVSQVFYVNSDKFPSVAQDYSDIQARVENHSKQPKSHESNHEPSLFSCAFESIPTFRRTSSLNDKAENGEYASIAGILGWTLVNIKEDWRDVVSAAKQIYSKINPNYHYDPLYNRKEYQHAFSATRGMIGEETLYKATAKENPFAQKIMEAGNTTIDDTKFGNYVKQIFKIDEVGGHKVDKIKNFKGRCARAYKFESSILGGKTIARAMKRTTVLGVAVMGLLELPKIAKETMKGDNLFEHAENFAKQTVKSAGNVALTTAGIAIGGAIGAKHLGAKGSLVGMGLGAVAASKISNTLQEALS